MLDLVGVIVSTKYYNIFDIVSSTLKFRVFYVLFHDNCVTASLYELAMMCHNLIIYIGFSPPFSSFRTKACVSNVSI